MIRSALLRPAALRPRLALDLRRPVVHNLVAVNTAAAAVDPSPFSTIHAISSLPSPHASRPLRSLSSKPLLYNSTTHWDSHCDASRFCPRVAPSPSSAMVLGLRHFHSTPRREALPLLPALGALLKGGSLLTLTTGLSRILISFFPIGILGTFKFARGVAWLAEDKRVPSASPDAEEFWKMWCDGESGLRLTQKEAASLVGAPRVANDGLLSAEGRIAYSWPMPQRFKRPEKPDDDDPAEVAKWAKKQQSRIHRAYFWLPDLPPASVRYYSDLSPTEQGEVDSLRRYWSSLRMFKARLRVARWSIATLVGLPIILLLLVWGTGLERVPLTGRWRLILLTADEEDAISTSLEGANWFKSVISLLTTPERPAPPIVPLTDWRWQWVQSTLRRLESGTIAAVERIEDGDVDRPPGVTGLWPPPSQYPLKPRARAAARLHAALPGGDRESGSEHLELGPPYNIMIMEAPDKNAFSYGFGGKGAGGIVIFTGLLDDILHRGAPAEDPPAPLPPPPSRGLFGGLLSSPPPPSPPIPTPTEYQTLHLATVIAHEMSHLLLSHHLETLSHQQVLWPSVLGLSMDIVRAFIWPFTLFLGPTVNDALANVGRIGTEELSNRYGHIGFEYKHEFEADFAALRLLAHAGFDPQAAVDKFADSMASLQEIQGDEETWWSYFKQWSWMSHPTPEERVEAMQDELGRWREEEGTGW